MVGFAARRFMDGLVCCSLILYGLHTKGLLDTASVLFLKGMWVAADMGNLTDKDPYVYYLVVR